MSFQESAAYTAKLTTAADKAKTEASTRNPRFISPPEDAPVKAQRQLNDARGKATRKRNSGGF